MKKIFTFISVILILNLTGCGQSGRLYLPDEKTSAVTTPDDYEQT